MRKILLIALLLLSGLSYSQERQQKEAVREQRNPQPAPPSNNYSGPRVPPVGGNVYYPPIRRGDLGWNTPFVPPTGRWNRWGSPVFGYDYWTPGFYNDPWGYRNPYRIYHYDDRRDTIRGKAIRLSFGVQLSTGRHTGAFLTLGDRAYFIAEYNQIFQIDESLFYPNLTRDRVIPWNDERLEDIKRGRTVYLGFGKKIFRTGVHALVGIGSFEKRYQFFDELYVLSNNGKYSIREFEENFVSVKLGVLHDLKRITLKLDVDPIRKQAFFGAGVNF